MTSQNAPSTPNPPGQPEGPADSVWTLERIMALGPTTDVPTLASILRCSRWKAYQMARTGQWEASGIRIIRIGSVYKVSVASILQVLGQAEASTARPGHIVARNGLESE